MQSNLARPSSKAARPNAVAGRRWTARCTGAGFLITVGAMALACAGSGAPQPANNAEACAQYVAHVNSLVCFGLYYDIANVCQGADLVPVDMRSHYACLVSHTRCDGETSILETEACEPPVLLAHHLVD